MADTTLKPVMINLPNGGLNTSVQNNTPEIKPLDYKTVSIPEVPKVDIVKPIEAVATPKATASTPEQPKVFEPLQKTKTKTPEQPVLSFEDQQKQLMVEKKKAADLAREQLNQVYQPVKDELQKRKDEQTADFNTQFRAVSQFSIDAQQQKLLESGIKPGSGAANAIRLSQLKNLNAQAVNAQSQINAQYMNEIMSIEKGIAGQVSDQIATQDAEAKSFAINVFNSLTNPDDAIAYAESMQTLSPTFKNLANDPKLQEAFRKSMEPKFKEQQAIIREDILSTLARQDLTNFEKESQVKDLLVQEVGGQDAFIGMSNSWASSVKKEDLVDVFGEVTAAELEKSLAGMTEEGRAGVYQDFLYQSRKESSNKNFAKNSILEAIPDSYTNNDVERGIADTFAEFMSNGQPGSVKFKLDGDNVSLQLEGGETIDDLAQIPELSLGFEDFTGEEFDDSYTYNSDAYHEKFGNLGQTYLNYAKVMRDSGKSGDILNQQDFYALKDEAGARGDLIRKSLSGGTVSSTTVKDIFGVGKDQTAYNTTAQASKELSELNYSNINNYSREQLSNIIQNSGDPNAIDKIASNLRSFDGSPMDIKTFLNTNNLNVGDIADGKTKFPTYFSMGSGDEKAIYQITSIKPEIVDKDTGKEIGYTMTYIDVRNPNNPKSITAKDYYKYSANKRQEAIANAIWEFNNPKSIPTPPQPIGA